MAISKNSSCSCGSGKKYKKCCLATSFEKIKLDLNTHFIAEISPQIGDECDRVTHMIEQGDMRGARKLAEKLQSLYPRSHEARFMVGVVCLQEENWQQAIKHFEAAVAIFPYFIEAHYNLGLAYLKEVQIPKAVESFRRIIAIAPSNDELRYDTERELESLEKMIREHYKCSLEDYIKNHKTFDAAFAYLNEQQYEKAIELFQQVLEKNPSHVQSYGNMGIAYSGLGERQKALECLHKALEIDPTYEPAKYNLIAISQLAEGEKLEIPIHSIEYYKERTTHTKKSFFDLFSRW